MIGAGWWNSDGRCFNTPWLLLPPRDAGSANEHGPMVLEMVVFNRESTNHLGVVTNIYRECTYHLWRLMIRSIPNVVDICPKLVAHCPLSAHMMILYPWLPWYQQSRRGKLQRLWVSWCVREWLGVPHGGLPEWTWPGREYCHQVTLIDSTWSIMVIDTNDDQPRLIAHQG